MGGANNVLSVVGGQHAPISVLRGARVLVVDADHFAVRSLGRTLRMEGCDVTTARSIEEARREIRLHGGELDAAVVELWLYDSLGVSIVSDLRSHQRPCCSLVITGSRHSAAVRQALAAGADELLLKPFEVHTFIACLERTVVKTRFWREQLDLVDREAPTASVGRLDASKRARLFKQGKGGEKRKIAGHRPLPTLGLLDIEGCADELMQLGDLSSRERDVLVSLLKGHHNGEIARELDARERTVKFHVSNILKKLRVTGRADLLRFFF